MELSPYLDSLRTDLAASAAAGGAEVARAGELLAGALDPAARMMLMELLSATADELTVALDPTQIEVRLRGREPELVVTHHELPEPPAPPSPPTPPAPEADEGTSRITLRLPESLKNRAEQAAVAEGVSVNTWLVQAVSRALDPASPPPSSAGRRRSGPHRYTGYARG